MRRLATKQSHRSIPAHCHVQTYRRGSAVLSVVLGIGAIFGVAESVGAQSQCGRGGCVSIVEVQGLIDEIVVDQVIDVIAAAEDSPDTRGVVIQIDSPGVVASTESLAMLRTTLQTAQTHTALWIGPSGSEVSGGAAELLGWVETTAIANGSSITPERPLLAGDTQPGAVEIGRTLDATAAVAAEMVDEIAPTIGDHVVGLEWIEKKVVTRDGQRRTEPVTVARFISLPLGTELLHTAASPAVAYLALIIGLGLLLFEFFTAGIGVAGVVGALALGLGGYGCGALPIRPWALVAIVLAMVAFAVDVQTAIPRFWTWCGLVMFTVGTLFLFDGVPRPWAATVIGIAGMAVSMVSGMPSMVRARFGTPTIGRDWMIGRLGHVVSAVNPEGIIRLDGAIWRARTHRQTPLEVGETARVTAIDGLLIEVEPETGGAIDYREMRSKKGSSETTGSTDADGGAPGTDENSE